MTTLLKGIVGSTAYGLATPTSDVDRLGIHVEPTERLLGLHPPGQTRDSHNPDIVSHEVGKYVSLALKCNPTVTELLWLPEDLYEEVGPEARELMWIRSAFLSKHHVKNAYLGYATAQFTRLRNRNDGTFSSDLRTRTAKHARHLWRLCGQGTELYTRGSLTVRLAPEEAVRCREFGEEVAAGNVDLAFTCISAAEAIMTVNPCVLPDTPNEGAIESWLLGVRKAFYNVE